MGLNLDSLNPIYMISFYTFCSDPSFFLWIIAFLLNQDFCFYLTDVIISKNFSHRGSNHRCGFRELVS